MFEEIRTHFELGQIDICSYSPLTLAYIGDGVYEVVIRTILVAKGNTSVNKLHQRSSRLVKASAQAQLILAIEDQLTPQELSVYRRGRNANSYSKAKNASMSEYHKATGMEALVGYLYLTGQEERMYQLLRDGLEKIDGQDRT